MDLLDRTLEEESEADKLLTKIATGGVIKSGINEQAPNASRSGYTIQARQRAAT